MVFEDWVTKKWSEMLRCPFCQGGQTVRTREDNEIAQMHSFYTVSHGEGFFSIPLSKAETTVHSPGRL